MKMISDDLTYSQRALNEMSREEIEVEWAKAVIRYDKDKSTALEELLRRRNENMS